MRKATVIPLGSSVQSVTSIYKMNSEDLKPFFGNDLTKNERVAKLQDEHKGVHVVLNNL